MTFTNFTVFLSDLFRLQDSLEFIGQDSNTLKPDQNTGPLGNIGNHSNQYHTTDLTTNDCSVNIYLLIIIQDCETLKLLLFTVEMTLSSCEKAADFFFFLFSTL